jgi:2-keto-4-pentenoate hydratase
MDRTARNQDDRLEAGMAAQRVLLDDAVRRGAQQAGWKAGLGGAAARASLGTDAPLVGVLLDTTSTIPGATVSLDGWTAPRAEAEIALRGGLRRGDVVILGSMVPVQTIGSGGTFTVMLDDHEPVSVRFA